MTRQELLSQRAKNRLEILSRRAQRIHESIDKPIGQYYYAEIDVKLSPYQEVLRVRLHNAWKLHLSQKKENVLPLHIQIMKGLGVSIRTQQAQNDLIKALKLFGGDQHEFKIRKVIRKLSSVLRSIDDTGDHDRLRVYKRRTALMNLVGK